MHVGETNVSSNIGNYAATVRYQIFDVIKPLILKSVLVNSYSAGERIIQLRDASGIVLNSKNINIPTGIQRVELNFEMDPGIDYQLGLGGTLGALGRSNAGVKYPYEINDYISIKASNALNAGLQFYYSFYDWEVVSIGCNDARQEYKVKIEQNTCLQNGLMSEELNSIRISPNPTQRFIKLTNGFNGTLSVKDLLGKVLIDKITFDDNLELDLLAWEKGVYLFEVNTWNGVRVFRIIKE